MVFHSQTLSAQSQSFIGCRWARGDISNRIEARSMIAIFTLYAKCARSERPIIGILVFRGHCILLPREFYNQFKGQK